MYEQLLHFKNIYVVLFILFFNIEVNAYPI
jgi:hypothetical protein